MKTYLRNFVYPFALIVLVGTFLTIILLFILYHGIGYNLFAEVDPDKRLDSFVKVLGVSISITGFVSIIVTIIQSRQTIQHDIKQRSVDLFRELRNEAFIDARATAWQAKEKWEKDKSYMTRLIDYNFSGRNDGKDETLNKEIKAIYQMMEFYLLVSVYDGNESNLKTLRYFYYGWWRNFLYAFGGEVEARTKTHECLSKPGITYLGDISYTRSFRRLDKIAGLDGIAEYTRLHDDGG
jgi:hypothetical protein